MGLVHNSCQGKCDWHPTDQEYHDQPLFRCSGCHSEWAPTEAWTPVGADGRMTQEVEAARAACPG
ncbi:hypothetical protein EII34_02845 [Arachnia propionica]|uniref:Uncharacterized protein n=1 Tax=Arachnia propionica TaxID=1750 RepID=A0A3P1TB95_9ACTN|nr:hypothetical protein [Arachnia propionica]MDO5082028.1 hypothetical protein [Arachnia propionica]RRD06580.1 hypothetical protein EII34_02845 [Arachnia propionica]